MAGNKAFSVSLPTVGDQKDVTVITTLLNDLLGFINASIGQGNWQLPDVAVSGTSGQGIVSDGTNQLILDHVLTADKAVDLDTTGDASGKIPISNGSNGFTLGANTANPTPTLVNSSVTVAANTINIVDSDPTVTITLPASPSLGDLPIVFIPADNINWEEDTWTLNPNSENIEGTSGNLTIDFRNTFGLVYTGATTGYRLLVYGGVTG